MKKTKEDHSLKGKEFWKKGTLDQCDENRLVALEWLLDESSYKKSGRSLLMAVAFIRIALKHPWKKIRVFDHIVNEQSAKSMRAQIQFLWSYMGTGKQIVIDNDGIEFHDDSVPQKKVKFTQMPNPLSSSSILIDPKLNAISSGMSDSFLNMSDSFLNMSDSKPLTSKYPFLSSFSTGTGPTGFDNVTKPGIKYGKVYDYFSTSDPYPEQKSGFTTEQVTEIAQLYPVPVVQVEDLQKHLNAIVDQYLNTAFDTKYFQDSVDNDKLKEILDEEPPPQKKEPMNDLWFEDDPDPKLEW